LQSLKIPVSHLALQEKFAAFVQAVDAQKTKAQKFLEKAEILYKALMQRYFA
jgi:restriction endonuclease S subunit